MRTVEDWMRWVEETLTTHDRRIRSKPSADPGAGGPPTGPAGGDLTGTYPNPLIGTGKVTSTHILDGTIVHTDVAAANKDGAAATPSMRTLGTGAQQAVSGTDARLSDARPPTTHQHSGNDITSGTVSVNYLPMGTTNATVAAGNHSHTWDVLVTGGTLDVPLVQDRIITPGSVPAGSQALYPKADGRYYVVGSDGVERPLIPVPDQLHQNPHFDSVAMSTDGPGGLVVTARLYPNSWGNFWSSGDGTVTQEADDTVTVEGLGYSIKSVFLAVDKQSILDSTVFAVTPGSVISASAWVRGTGPYAEFGIYTKQDADPSVFDPVTVMTTAIVPNTTWQKITASAVVPAGHNRCRITLRAFSSGIGTTGSLWWDATESNMLTQPLAQVIPGTIVMWPTGAAPEGYLLCNGTTFQSTAYPALATILGDTYGTHSGTTYTLPDFRGRSPLGPGMTSPAVPGGTTHTLAQKGGEETHALTLTENAAHSHSGTSGNDNTEHTHATGMWTTGNEAGGYGLTGSAQFEDRVMVGGVAGGVTGGRSAYHQHTFTTSDSGSGNGHNTMHPYLGIQFIIKW